MKKRSDIVLNQFSRTQLVFGADNMGCRKHCICPPGAARKCTERRDIPGSTAFVPFTVGLIIAGEVIKDILAFYN